MKKTLIIGSTHVDILSKVKQLPKGNEEIHITRTKRRVDSPAFTMAKQFRLFDFDFEYLSPLGDGIYAENVKEEAERQNIDMKYHLLGMNGCTYTLMDDNGDTSQIIMPGAEYEFDLSLTEDLYPEEIGNIVLFGEMLTGEDESIEDLLEALDDLDKPIIFIPNGRSQDIPAEAFQSLLQLKPAIYLTDTEAYYLAGEYSGELRDTADHLFDLTKCRVMIMKQSEGCFVKEEKDVYLAPCKENINIEKHVSLFAIAKQAGVDDKNALMFAYEYANDLKIAKAKRRLAGMILQ